MNIHDSPYDSYQQQPKEVESQGLQPKDSIPAPGPKPAKPSKLPNAVVKQALQEVAQQYSPQKSVGAHPLGSHSSSQSFSAQTNSASVKVNTAGQSRFVIPNNAIKANTAHLGQAIAKSVDKVMDENERFINEAVNRTNPRTPADFQRACYLSVSTSRLNECLSQTEKALETERHLPNIKELEEQLESLKNIQKNKTEGALRYTKPLTSDQKKTIDEYKNYNKEVIKNAMETRNWSSPEVSEAIAYNQNLFRDFPFPYGVHESTEELRTQLAQMESFQLRDQNMSNIAFFFNEAGVKNGEALNSNDMQKVSDAINNTEQLLSPGMQWHPENDGYDEILIKENPFLENKQAYEQLQSQYSELQQHLKRLEGSN